MANSRKKCKQCEEFFKADTMIKTGKGMFCTLDHAAKWSINNIAAGRARKFLGERKTPKKKSKLHKIHLTDDDFAKVSRNHVHPKIRKRDAGLPCISCGDPWSDSHQAGHFKAVGSQWRRSWLRYHPWNINGQCVDCNCNKSGNESGYTDGIIDRFGVDRLEQIKTLKEMAQRSPPLNYDDLQKIKAGTYKFPLIDQDSN